MLPAMIALFVGIVACAGMMFLSGKIPSLTLVYSFMGGLFIVFYVLGITWIAPKFGVENAVHSFY